jgi:hypothetical protein
MRILIGVGVVAVLFSSCTLINKIQDKLFPYRNKSVDDIAVQKPASPKQTPAPVQVTITPKAEPAKTSEPPIPNPSQKLPVNSAQHGSQL